MAVNTSLAWSSMATNSASQPAPLRHIASIACDAVTRPHNASKPSKLLGVDVQQITGCFVLVARDRPGGLQVTQSGQNRRALERD